MVEAPVTFLQWTSSDANSLSVFLRLGNSCSVNLGERSEPTSHSQILDCRILAFSASFQLGYRTCLSITNQRTLPTSAVLFEVQGLMLRGSGLLTRLILWFGFGLSGPRRWKTRSQRALKARLRNRSFLLGVGSGQTERKSQDHTCISDGFLCLWHLEEMER